MHDTLESRVRTLMAGSELLRVVAATRGDAALVFAFGDSQLRALHKLEIACLESLGNTARDWSRVRVAEGFNPRRVRNCEFHGDIALGRFTQYVRLADGIEVIAGLTGSTVSDCVIGHDALVRNVRVLANYVLGEGAVVVDCGRVTCSPGTTFGNGARVPLALEGGGRDVDVFAELDVELAATVARPGARRRELDGYRRAVAAYREAATADRGVIGPRACVWSVPRIEDAFIGTGARVDGAAAVIRTTVLSTDEEPTRVESGALVIDSLLQPGCEVSGAAAVENTVLVEHSHVERHGKVRNSVLGPNTQVAAGEVSSCILGPFVGCHHQSLLISTLWPAGRGNVGYGANVGSNHTSRAPDQEFWAGEGLFLGLGANVKFPCDFSLAPYTTVACATNLAPQRVTFPFSLVAPRQDHFTSVPPTFNQISPGWMLRENIYALKRNEAKFRARNQSRRAKFDFAVFRPETVQLMRSASRALASVPVVKELYTEADVPGLGKNVLTERDRVRGQQAYEFYALYYALLGLKEQVRAMLFADQDVAAVLMTESGDEVWEFQRQILSLDFGLLDPVTALRMLLEAATRVANDTARGREKDDVRGARVIDDYSEVHPSAERDRVVRQAWEEALAIRQEVAECLQRLPGDTAAPLPEGSATSRAFA